MRTGGCSIKGSSRDRNEDCLYVDRDGRYCIVADGIGGSAAGEIASQLACRFLSQSVSAICDSVAELPKAIFELRQAFESVNDLLIAHRGHDPRLAQMGTTAVVACIAKDHLLVAGLGDSRGYLIRDGQATQLTIDHTIANGLVEAGVLSPADVRFHPYRNVLHKFLGCEEIGDGADVECVDLQIGDRVLLATDGITDRLGHETLAAIVDRHRDPQAAAEQLVEQAVYHGTSDDATCVVAAIEGFSTAAGSDAVWSQN